MMRSKKFSIAMLLLLMPVTIAIGWGRMDSKTTTQQEQQACTWQFTGDTEALSKGGDGMSATRSENSILTSYTYAGGLDCKEQTFQSTHTWTAPGSSLTPGQELTFDVSASWNLDGSAQCNSMVTGILTSITAGLTTIKAEDRQINVSTEPSGSVSNQGSWVVPSGGNPGQTMSIAAHGEQAGVGGNIFYKYQWVCQPTEGPTEEESATPEPSVTPETNYSILIDSSKKDPLVFTIALVQLANGSLQDVPGVPLRISALGYEGNETRLAEEFLVDRCQNCAWRTVGGFQMARLLDPNQPIIAQTGTDGRVKLTLLLDFRKLGDQVPRPGAPLVIPIAVEYMGNEDGETILAEADLSVSLEAIGVVSNVTYKPAQNFDWGGKPLSRVEDNLERYNNDEGIRDGARILKGSDRVLYNFGGKESTAPSGQTPGTTLIARQLLHVGDQVTINACGMISNKRAGVGGPSAGADGEVWVKVRFFDGTRAKVGVNANVCKTTVTFGETPQSSGWKSGGTRFFYWSAKGVANAIIGAYVPPYKILTGINTVANALAWLVGNESAGWNPVYIELKSEMVVAFDQDGTMQVTTREGEPVIHTEMTVQEGVPVPVGQTAQVAVDSLVVEVQETDNETAMQADALLADLLDTSDEIDINADSTQAGDNILSLIPRNIQILVGALCCLVLVGGVVFLGGLMLLLIRRRNKK